MVHEGGEIMVCLVGFAEGCRCERSVAGNISLSLCGGRLKRLFVKYCVIVPWVFTRMTRGRFATKTSTTFQKTL